MKRFDTSDLIHEIAVILYWVTVLGIWAWIALSLIVFNQGVAMFIFTSFIWIVLGGLVTYAAALFIAPLSFVVAAILVGITKLFQAARR